MKKCLLGWAVVFALPVIGVGAYKTYNYTFGAKAVEKRVSIDIYKSNPYKSKVYDGTSAQVEIILEKVKGSSRTVVWDTVYDAKALKQYPSIENALSKNITGSVIDKKERLEIKYLVTFNSTGHILQMQGGPSIIDSCSKIDISL